MAGDWERMAGDWERMAGDWERMAGDWERMAGDWERMAGDRYRWRRLIKWGNKLRRHESKDKVKGTHNGLHPVDSAAVDPHHVSWLLDEPVDGDVIFK